MPRPSPWYYTWTDIPYRAWTNGNLTIHMNHQDNRPVVLQRNDRVVIRMTPEEVREVATELVKAARALNDATMTKSHV